MNSFCIIFQRRTNNKCSTNTYNILEYLRVLKSYLYRTKEHYGDFSIKTRVVHRNSRFFKYRINVDVIRSTARKHIDTNTGTLQGYQDFNLFTIKCVVAKYAMPGIILSLLYHLSALQTKPDVQFYYCCEIELL